MKIPWLEHESYEADDIIASAVNSLKSSFSNIIIASTDSDFFQLLNYNTSIIRRKSNLFLLEDFYNSFGFSPEYYVDYLSLKGDKSDNIAGTEGIGHKRASFLIQEFKTLERIFDNLDLLNSYYKNRLKGNFNSLVKTRNFLRMNNCIIDIDFLSVVFPLVRRDIPKRMGMFLIENKNKIFSQSF